MRIQRPTSIGRTVEIARNATEAGVPFYECRRLQDSFSLFRVPVIARSTPPMSEGMLIAQRLSAIFTADDFTQTLLRFTPGYRDIMIGHAIVYHIVFPDGEGFSRFMDEQFAWTQAGGMRIWHGAQGSGQRSPAVLARFIAQRLGISNVDAPPAKRDILEYFFDRFHRRGFVFHGFNGVMADSIRSHGLSVTHRLWSPQEITSINEILVPHYRINPLASDTPKIYYDSGPYNSYSYACTSPEWFERFCDIGVEMATGSSAFVNRDHERARRNMQAFCQTHAYSREDTARLLTFLDTIWARLAGPHAIPMIALIDRRAIDTSDLFLTECALEDIEHKNTNVERPIDSAFADINIAVEHAIPPSAVFLAKLPSYTQIHPEVPED